MWAVTHWERPWYWERLRARGDGSKGGGDGWMASLTQWTWVWANSGRWWRTRNLACCSPWGWKSGTWLSDWTTTKYRYLLRRINSLHSHNQKESLLPFWWISVQFFSVHFKKIEMRLHKMWILPFLLKIILRLFPYLRLVENIILKDLMDTSYAIHYMYLHFINIHNEPCV